MAARPGRRLGAAFGFDGARPGAAAVSGALRLERDDGERTLSLALSRVRRQDSFRALAGERVGGVLVGAASDLLVEGRAAWASETARLETFARAGSVTGAGMPDTFLAAAGARLDRTIGRAGRWRLSAGAAAEATHHGRDLSGMRDGDPASPRLFSPPLFLVASPRLSLAREAPAGVHLVLDAGPALQLVAVPGGALRAGGDVHASVVQPIGQRLRLAAEVRAERIAAVHALASGGASLAVVF